MYGSSTDDQSARQKVATIQIATVDRDEIYLVLPVRSELIPGGCAGAGPEIDSDYAGSGVEASVLALHSKQLVADLETQVEPSVLDDRAQDGDAEVGGRCRDLDFGDRPFPVAVHSKHMFA